MRRRRDCTVLLSLRGTDLIVRGAISSALYADTFARLTKAVGALLDRAVAAGEIRADIGPEDLLRTLIGMCYLHDQPGWQASVMRMLDVLLDGLRVKPGAGKPAARRPSKDARTAWSENRVLVVSVAR